ncbi:hypothetical protein ABIE53_001480 [Burkholderia sp. OAS925]|jgi:hypothetical protein|nr:hypothetical protein [Paraburkholderia graminis]MDR6476985.1 hypothetical protein [Paraburkholderia graminis]
MSLTVNNTPHCLRTIQLPQSSSVPMISGQFSKANDRFWSGGAA